MKKQIFMFMIVIIAILSSTSFKFDNKNLTDEFERIKQRGITYSFIDNQTIELEQEWSGFKRTKTRAEPNDADINSFIQKYDIPLLEIDPTLIDTSQYDGWYNYWTTVPVSNGTGVPLQVGDFNNNGKAEIYGSYKNFYTDYETHVYEIDTNGTFSQLYNYIPRHGSSMQITDVDNNGLLEVVFQFGDSSFFYEQSSINGLPINRKFAHAKYEYPGTAIGTKETVISMDNDSLIDFVYRGTLQDTTPSGFQLYTFVAEYNKYLNNFAKVWKTQLWKPNGESGLGGYDVGDYDGDGKMDFLATGIWGQVWVVENKADNDYGLIWKDSIPFVNLFYQTSGDVDGDGKREFFVGATMSNGNWTVMYEADSNNSYSPKFSFHLFSGGSLDEPTYMTVDLDNDNKLELVILSGADLYFFKSDADNSYYLWYYKKLFAKRSIQFYDITGDGIKDYIISYNLIDNQGRLKFSADIYKATGLSNVNNDTDINLPKSLKLYQNYPNPFNSSTKIKYEISSYQLVNLSIYNTQGQKIETLINEQKPAGIYEISWNAKGLPSGVYYYRLKTSSNILSKKLLLVK